MNKKENYSKVIFSFFVHLSLAFCRHSSRLVSRFYGSVGNMGLAAFANSTMSGCSTEGLSADTMG